MPIEIFELVIKATVNEEVHPSRSQQVRSTNTGENTRKNKQELAEQINEILKRKKER